MSCLFVHWKLSIRRKLAAIYPPMFWRLPHKSLSTFFVWKAATLAVFHGKTKVTHWQRVSKVHPITLNHFWNSLMHLFQGSNKVELGHQEQKAPSILFFFRSVFLKRNLELGESGGSRFGSPRLFQITKTHLTSCLILETPKSQDACCCFVQKACDLVCPISCVDLSFPLNVHHTFILCIVCSKWDILEKKITNKQLYILMHKPVRVSVHQDGRDRGTLASTIGFSGGDRERMISEAVWFVWKRNL